MTKDERFTRRLYTVAEAARLVGMYPSTLDTWAHGYERRPDGRPVVKKGPVITALDRTADDGRSVPFIGLVEASVVQAFRQTGLPMQRIRRALEVLTEQGELEHALASRQLYSDGAEVLYDYARNTHDKQLGLLTIVSSGQRVFHDVISQYLELISFDDTWASELVLPVTERPLLRVVPEIESGDPLFVHGGAPLSAVRSRFVAGEPVESIALDYGVPSDEIEEALGAIWPAQQAA
ncbi:MAG: DUF433 domain-containing protein [Actinomycetia bacterium]|nr:DUF433 domain-containing protein [Actinomycetes bacterium]